MNWLIIFCIILIFIGSILLIVGLLEFPESTPITTTANDHQTLASLNNKDNQLILHSQGFIKTMIGVSFIIIGGILGIIINYIQDKKNSKILPITTQPTPITTQPTPITTQAIPPTNLRSSIKKTASIV